MSEEIADLLDAAADVLEKEGWIQGNLSTPRGYCAIGALGRARALQINYDSTVKFDDLTSRAERSLGVDTTLPVWNDQEGRTKQEVLDLLRLKAKEARS